MGAIGPLRFPNLKTAVRQHQNFRSVSFKKFGAIEPLCFRKMSTAKGGSIAPNFPKGFA